MERILTLMSSGNNQEMELVTQVIHNIMGYLAIMQMVDIHHCIVLISPLLYYLMHTYSFSFSTYEISTANVFLLFSHLLLL